MNERWLRLRRRAAELGMEQVLWLRRLSGRWRSGMPFRVPGGLRLWITLLSMGFVLAALVNHGRQLAALSPDVQGWLWLLLGVGFSLLSLVVNSLAWGVVMRWLGIRPAWEALVTLYMTSNLRKYLPGGIWHLASRVQTLRRGHQAVPRPTGTGLALVAVLMDPLLAAVAALALVPIGGWQRGLALLCLLPLGLLLPRWLQPLLLRLERKRARELDLESDLSREEASSGSLSLRGYPLGPLLAELGFVVVRFAGFACSVQAFDLQNQLDWPGWLAGFALAWTVGLVVPGAPGGLGVFEAVLLLRLSVSLPEAPLLAVALSYRLTSTAADLLGAWVAGLDERLRLAAERRSGNGPIIPGPDPSHASQ